MEPYRESVPLDDPGDECKPRLDEPALERWRERGILMSTLETVQQLLFKPGEMFPHFKRTGVRIPIVFMLLTGLAAALTTTGLVAVYMVSLQKYLGGMSAGASGLEVFDTEYWISTTLFTVALTPAFGIGLLLVLSGCGFGLLRLFKAGAVTFVTTLRATAYCMGATSVIALLPICGYYIAPFWYATIMIIGLAHLLDCGYWKTAFPVLGSMGVVAVIWGAYIAVAYMTQRWQFIP